ncbi:aldose epimerase family protein [Enterococcus quebecensis]|uniref:Aldose 1-epimerase n=1 Tax=Enterococcus quebecensis TaxID=903983 RepID=A0A1E5H316_9ENTE|nr:aldose epimerase family protein [Enterococcus quebecensis]OEG19293.1 galactose mutarotase [Enterococcus quebecensis]OJG75792.1 galactose mutarotase [Enterococcus quebecensis]
MKVTEKKFGEHAFLYSLTNNNGVTLEATNLGARIVNLYVPTAVGRKNIVLGFDSEKEYVEKDLYFGATIGRVAGRIKNGQFSIDKKNYQVFVDPNTHHCLHGGPHSFEEKIWETAIKENDEELSVVFTHTSPANENGFPGTITVSVTYSLSNQNEWKITYQASTNESTLFNPTNHVYFNLTGDPTKTVADHQLLIDADKFVVVDSDTNATGEKRSVANTPFDFRTIKKVNEVFQTNYEQNVLVDGLDHPFILNHKTKETPQAVLVSPESDITVNVYTDRDTVVIFTAQFGNSGPEVHGNQVVHHGGITFETQTSPGAVEFEGFGDIILRPGKDFYSQTVYALLLSDDEALL